MKPHPPPVDGNRGNGDILSVGTDHPHRLGAVAAGNAHTRGGHLTRTLCAAERGWRPGRQRGCVGWQMQPRTHETPTDGGSVGLSV